MRELNNKAGKSADPRIESQPCLICGKPCTHFVDSVSIACCDDDECKKEVKAIVAESERHIDATRNA